MKRLFHHWQMWECFPAGMHETVPPDGKTADDCRAAYAVFLRDTPRFEAALARVLAEWPYSCEQFLSNEHINRIAWLGQSSMCIATGIPAHFRGGFHILTEQERAEANATAKRFLDIWEAANAGKDSGLPDNVGEPWIPAGDTGGSTGQPDAGAASAVLQGNLFGDSQERCDA